ncbi:MAG: hypothetical protein KAS12_01530 [Candidatus Aenigmarchaeota archaeon]|nr:hypothetical protein [Candidatus Aenigmarchaeota archaeon]
MRNYKEILAKRFSRQAPIINGLKDKKSVLDSDEQIKLFYDIKSDIYRINVVGANDDDFNMISII